MLSTAIAYLEGPTKLEGVIFCLYDQQTFGIFKDTLESLMCRR